MKKILTPLAVGLVAVFGLFACLGGDKGGGGGALGGSIEILNHDATNHTITTRTISYYCAGAVVMADTTVETNAYTITGGKLYIWDPTADFANDPDQCYADVATGSSNTIIGTWTAVQPPEAIPTQPAGCPTPLPPHSGNTNGMPVGMIFTVTASSVTLSMTGDICLAEQMANEFTGGGITASNVTCNSATLTNSTNAKTATLTSSSSNGVMSLVFHSGTANCTMTQSMELPGVRPTCPQDDGSAFQTCMLGSGFFTTPVTLPAPLTKRGVF